MQLFTKGMAALLLAWLQIKGFIITSNPDKKPVVQLVEACWQLHRTTSHHYNDNWRHTGVEVEGKPLFLFLFSGQFAQMKLVNVVDKKKLPHK